MGPDWSLVFAATVVSLPVCFTPGINNIICATIGATYGLRAGVPYMLGVTVGFPFVLLFAGVGMGGLLKAYPEVHFYVRVFAVLFFLYLAYRVAVAAAPGEIERERRPPPGFYRALLIQWINPKGLSYALSLTGLYVRPTAVVTDVAALMVMTAVLSFLSTLTWTLGGSVISRFLKTPRTFFWFKFVMVAFLLYAMTGILDF